MFSSPLLYSTSLFLPTLSWGFCLPTLFSLFSSQYLNSSSSFTVDAAYFPQLSVCIPVVCLSTGHKAFWCMIHHTFHYLSTKSDPGFQPIHYQTNWSLSKTSRHLICAPACSFHAHHHKPTKKQKSVKNAGEIDTMFGVRSWREGHLRLSELYMREWLRTLMERGHAALIGVITE